MTAPAIQVTVHLASDGWRWVALTAGGETLDASQWPFATVGDAVIDAGDHCPPSATIVVAKRGAVASQGMPSKLTS